MGTVKVTNIEPIADNGTVTLGGSGDTITLGSGATVTGTGLVGITMADQWRLTADTNQGTNAVISTNWERVDETNYSSIGTGLTESSGVFTFPQTGIYYISMYARITQDAGDSSSNIFGQYFVNSVEDDAFLLSCNNQGSTQNGSGTFMFNVTNTTTHKMRFKTASFTGTTRIRAVTNRNDSYFTVIRLGDSV